MIDLLQHHPRPLGHAQQHRRQAELDLRRRAANLIDGHTQAAVASSLHIAPQTLADWKRLPQDPPSPRGRPSTPIDPILQDAVRQHFDAHGCAIGIPALKQLFPQVPRAALGHLRDSWEQAQQAEHTCLLWTTPGTVWSCDFTQTPEPIDGAFDHLLVVRDLASHYTLLASPCLAQCAAEALFHLNILFRQLAPPLVLKTDNGSPFIAHDIHRFFLLHRVQNLLSPPLTPQYNGSIESTGGHLKTRAAQIARHHQCAPWNSDILEAARLTANTCNRPWGLTAPTPAQRWNQRQPIQCQQRDALEALIRQKTDDITASILRQRQEKGLATEITAACRASVARTAIRQALVELGYLQVRSTPIMSTQFNPDLSEN